MFRRLVVFLTAVGALALASPAAFAADGDPATTTTRPTGRDPVALARQKLDDARVEATAIASKLADTQTQQAKLEAEIADAEQKVPALRARATELKAEVKERARLLYVRHGATGSFEATMDAESTQDGLRAAHLTDTIGAQGLAAATELKNTAEQLAEHEKLLVQQRAELQKTLADLGPLNEQLQLKLLVASTLYDKVKALVADGALDHGVDVATTATACPVKGFVVFTDDFGELRTGGAHPGIDMAAVADTPVVAVADGVWRRDVGGDGGNGAWLTGLDDVSYYYAHFSRYEGTGEGGEVRAGDVIGYVGMTGNATGPHLHFEIHKGKPGQGPPLDPFATLLALCNGSLPLPKAN